jgi:hypothetical protein
VSEANGRQAWGSELERSETLGALIKAIFAGERSELMEYNPENRGLVYMGKFDNSLSWNKKNVRSSHIFHLQGLQWYWKNAQMEYAKSTLKMAYFDIKFESKKIHRILLKEFTRRVYINSSRLIVHQTVFFLKYVFNV